MRISYRTHPALESLFKGSLTNVPIQKDDDVDVRKLLQNIGGEFLTSAPSFRKEIIVVSQSFSDAAGLAHGRLNDLYDNIRSESPEDLAVDGTFIIGGNLFMITHRQDGDRIKCVFFLFDKQGYLRSYFNSVSNENHRFWLASITPRDGRNELDIITNMCYLPIQLSLFRRYAQVQTVELPAGQKVKGIDCNYKNDTGLNITHLDSTWFTNLVKSDAFKVRGHFRLQPKKKGEEWIKELIWINDYMKEGYYAQARKLKE